MLPGELQKGDRLTADWINQLVREAVSRTLNAGPGLRLTRTPSGTTVSLAPQRGGVAGGVHAALAIVSGSGSGPVSGELSDGSGERLLMPAYTSGLTLSTGTPVVALRATTLATVGRRVLGG